MTLISSLLLLLGGLLLSHATYSAHEHHKLLIPNSPSPPLPTDITLETLLATLLLSLGLIQHSSRGFQPVSWRAWAGQVEKDGRASPFGGLEARTGFWDVRARRREFAEWVREGAEEKAKAL
ncbi:MAG: hypothetical protein M1813_004302 [Trichoglossum hirsutum]|nr:MAG: hypothetical protein M1813_004302 [Trichoglossum hirsutum]